MTRTPPDHRRRLTGGALWPQEGILRQAPRRRQDAFCGCALPMCLVHRACSRCALVMCACAHTTRLPEASGNSSSAKPAHPAEGPAQKIPASVHIFHCAIRLQGWAFTGRRMAGHGGCLILGGPHPVPNSQSYHPHTAPDLLQSTSEPTMEGSGASKLGPADSTSAAGRGAAPRIEQAKTISEHNISTRPVPKLLAVCRSWCPAPSRLSQHNSRTEPLPGTRPLAAGEGSAG